MNDNDDLYLIVIERPPNSPIVHKEYGYINALHRAKVSIYSKMEIAYVAKITEKVHLKEPMVEHL